MRPEFFSFPPLHTQLKARMNISVPAPIPAIDPSRYARCIEASKRIRWDIEDDVIRGRRFDFSQRFLPEGLALVEALRFLSPQQRLLLNHIQGRTYANMFGLVERFIGAQMIELCHHHRLGDQVAFEALVRFTDEELKHQALFRRIEALIAPEMPAGYRFDHDADAVAGAVLAASSWAVLALTCHIELFTQVHYRQSMQADESLSPLYKDVFLHHWKEESQHAILDELEWQREDASLSPEQRSVAVNELIALVQAVDGIVQAQARNDADYFSAVCCSPLSAEHAVAVHDQLLRAYRWQYIVSGLRDPRFSQALGALITPQQGQYIQEALAPLMA
jgi:P-aminobenzoate N-oxygenase AurF